MHRKKRFFISAVAFTIINEMEEGHIGRSTASELNCY
jgi:hypothetical protein